MIHAYPVIVPVNPSACNLVELLQLAAAYLAYLAIRDLDLSIIAQHYYHNQVPYLSARGHEAFGRLFELGSILHLEYMDYYVRAGQARQLGSAGSSDKHLQSQNCAGSRAGDSDTK